MCNKCAYTELLGVAVPEMTEQLVKGKPRREGKNVFYYPDKWCIWEIWYNLYILHTIKTDMI